MRIRWGKETEAHELVPLMLDYIVDFYQQPNSEPEKVEGLVRHLLTYPDVGQQ
jgi:hypothetical protein